MKKTLKMAVAASVLTAPAMAANMENPLYLPKSGEVYSKTSAGVMYKKADSTDAQVAKGHDGADEFPIWRIHEEIGVGITDRLALHGSFGYTKDGDIDRKGLHLGRVGMTYRMFEEHGSIWDIYADAHLGGVGKMKGAFVITSPTPPPSGVFNYDNYSNGRWGFHVGTKIGNTWGNLSAAMFAEVLQTFGNHNNEIDLVSLAGNVDLGTISVDLKSTTEFNAGLKMMYQFDTRWSLGGSFTFKHHANNGIKGVHSADLTAAGSTLEPMLPIMAASMSNMEDGFDEYIIGVSIANQLTDYTQVALYADYTMDTAQRMSQNGSDIKAELGVRLNVSF